MRERESGRRRETDRKWERKRGSAAEGESGRRREHERE